MADLFDLVIPPECLPFIRLQRTYLNLSREPNEERVREIYIDKIRRDHFQFYPFIPPDVRKIVAIGCGIGGQEVVLARHFPGAELWLLDGDGYSVHHKGTVNETSNAGWHANDTSVYNSRELTTQFMQANGVQPAGWYDLNTKERIEADLFFSLSSWGFHYPFSTYDVHGRVLCDLRRGIPENTAILSTLAQRRGRLIYKGPKYDRVVFTH